MIAAIGIDLDDMAELVIRPRVGGIDLFRLAAGIVGQHHIDLVGLGIGLDILRPVHPGGAQLVRRQPGMDQHGGLIREAILCHQGPLPLHQRQPGAGAIRVEPGDMERAGIQKIPVRGLSAVFTVPALTNL